MTKTTQHLGTPQRHGVGWFVPSGAVGYYVERLEGRWRCTCPSFRWRKTGTCKHIVAVKRFLAEEVVRA
jgi:SWIM zinc finger